MDVQNKTVHTTLVVSIDRWYHPMEETFKMKQNKGHPKAASNLKDLIKSPTNGETRQDLECIKAHKKGCTCQQAHHC